MELFVLAALVSAALVGWWHWENHIKQRPLAEFGIDAVHRVLNLESESTRKQILNRGWMTRDEWIGINKRQLEAIAAELRRRGTDK